MREVGADDFYKKIGKDDVVGSIVSKWPYKTEYTLRYGRAIVGESQEQSRQGQPTRYFLAEEVKR